VLEEKGLEVVPMSRAAGVDVITGSGLAEAMKDVDFVIDVSSGPSSEEGQATEFFTTAARNLHEAGQRAGVKGMVVVSIIGCDKFPTGYGHATFAHERAALAGPVPVRILRAAQFHELVPVLMGWGTRDGVCRVPKMRTQLVAARTVAQALVDVALEPDWAPAGPARTPVPEIAGPREESLIEMAKMVAVRQGGALRVEEVDDPSDPDRLPQTGGLLPGPHAKLAGPTFEQWLGSVPARSLLISR
jgi:uncharacterized protein YbjT (DUF2867 family)